MRKQLFIFFKVCLQEYDEIYLAESYIDLMSIIYCQEIRDQSTMAKIFQYSQSLGKQ